MRKASLIAAFAAAVGMGGSAHAADLYGGSYKDPAPIEVSAPVWTGFYVGAGIGAGAAVNDLDANLAGVIGANLDGIGGEGAFGTVQVGYDRQIDRRFVIGAFFDYDFSDISTDASISILGQKAGMDIDVDHMWSIGGRLGYLLNESTMVYALLAYTEASFDAPSFGGVLDIDDFQGYSVGGGLETQLHDNWFLKAEYRFTQLDSENVLGRGLRGFADVDLEPSIHTARAVLTYKFDPFGRYHDPLK
jgi:outer membrane immunogenic protein